MSAKKGILIAHVPWPLSSTRIMSKYIATSIEMLVVVSDQGHYGQCENCKLEEHDNASSTMRNVTKHQTLQL